jgi:hypothetical protein
MWGFSQHERIMLLGILKSGFDVAQASTEFKVKSYGEGCIPNFLII